MIGQIPLKFQRGCKIISRARQNFLSFCLLLSAVFAAEAQTYTFDIRQTHPDGIYASGEPITFQVRMFEDGEVAIGKQVRCILYRARKEIRRDDFASEGLVEYSAGLDEPGWFQLTVVGLDADGKTLYHDVDGRSKPALAYSGALVDPLSLEQGLAEPADFDAFWAKEKEKLAAIPLEAKRTPYAKAPSYAQVEFVEIPVGSGFRPVNAVIKMPAKAQEKSLPILLHVHGAGVHGPANPLWQHPLPDDSGLEGPVIFMNLNAHGIPNDRPKAYYQDLKKGELNDYPYQNSDDPDRYYMKGMILRLARALEYLKSLPEWNGRDVVVNGGSQGGAQALIAGGIDPDVTFVYADVPAMCDFGGTLVGRASGWPKPYEQREDGSLWLATSRDRKDAVPVSLEEVVHLGYFDAANFARRIQAKVVTRTGGWDGVCPPTSVFVAYNNVPHANKMITFAPQGGHTRGNYEADAQQDLAYFVGDEKRAPHLPSALLIQ